MSEYIPIDVLGIYSKLVSHQLGITLFISLVGGIVVVKIKSVDEDKIPDVVNTLKLEYVSKVYYNNDIFIKLINNKEFEANIIQEVQTYKILE